VLARQDPFDPLDDVQMFGGDIAFLANVARQIIKLQRRLAMLQVSPQ